MTNSIISIPTVSLSVVQWSQVVENTFDGAVVYDKHYANNFTFVSSRSKQDI
jgi:hypothetical protein